MSAVDRDSLLTVHWLQPSSNSDLVHVFLKCVGRGGGWMMRGGGVGGLRQLESSVTCAACTRKQKLQKHAVERRECIYNLVLAKHSSPN